MPQFSNQPESGLLDAEFALDAAPDAEFSAGGVIADSSYYAGAVEALRSACAQIGEAADAVQRAGFFAGIASWQDEADASAHDAERVSVTAMAEALRAQGAVAVYADAANRTLAEVRVAFATTKSSSAEQEIAENLAGETAELETRDQQVDFTEHMADALAVLATDRDQTVAGSDAQADYIKLAKTLSVLAEARQAYREVDNTLIMLANARSEYLEESATASRTALASDLKTEVLQDISAACIGSFRSAITALAVTRTAYNAEVSNELWGALAQARINLAAATATVLEIKAATGESADRENLHSASALAYSFGDAGTPTDVYDAARDVVIEAKEFRRRAQSACDEVDKLLIENRAVAADALIEAQAAVGVEALGGIRSAYEITSAAMNSLFGSRAAFEVGFDFTLPELFGD
ncbi:MAG: hypothetical protein F4138_03430 [Acidimicrobiia bacterium]|nr:hypothetical protein [Acidimicrobiia bacterium]